MNIGGGGIPLYSLLYIVLVTCNYLIGQQTVIDTYSKIEFAKLYDRKNALVAADMLNDRAIPFYCCPLKLFEPKN